MKQLKGKPKTKLKKLHSVTQPYCTTTMYKGADGKIYEREKWKVGTVKWFLVSE